MLPGGEIIDTVVFSSGWDVLSANTVVIGTTVMSGGIEYVYGAVSQRRVRSLPCDRIAGDVLNGGPEQDSARANSATLVGAGAVKRDFRERWGLYSL